LARNYIEPSLSLHGFHEYGRYLFGRHLALEEQFQFPELRFAEIFQALPGPIMVMIRKRDPVHFRSKGSAAQFIPHFGSQGHGHHGPSMKALFITNDGWPARGLTGDLDGIFNAFGSAVGQHNFGPIDSGPRLTAGPGPAATAVWEQGRQSLGQFHV
jgi:hypothetical protein